MPIDISQHPASQGYKQTDDGRWYSPATGTYWEQDFAKAEALPQQRAAQQAYAQPGFTQWTPEQVAAYRENQMVSPNQGMGIYDDPNAGGIWSGPLQQGYGRNGVGGASDWDHLTSTSEWIGDLDNMKGGLAIMAAPFAVAGGAALAAGGAGAGAAGGELGTLGLDASTGLFAGESATSGAAGGGVFSGGAGGDLGGGGMWDWLDDNSVFPGETTNSGPAGTDDFGFDPSSNTFPGESTTSGPAGPTDISTTTDPGLMQKAANLAKQLGINPQAALKLLGGAGGKGSTGGGILDSILGDPLGSAFNAAPFLLALNEANKQSGDLNGVIGKINEPAYRKAVLDPYDLETGQGRAMMRQDQGLRGVAGSSFGDQSLNNYDYMRNLGRGDIASKANLAAAGLEGQLINTRNTNRNLLLGAGLNASGKLFSPQKDPFNLNQLFGIT